MKKARQGTPADAASSQSFVETIIAFSKNLESEKISIDLQNLFLKYAEAGGRNTLPGGSKPVLIDQFLTIVISLITYNQSQPVGTRSLRILFEYLKNDPQVYARFRPNRIILRKMNIAHLILSQSDNESDLALDFSSFLLRYNRELDYQDFSDDLNIQNKIKRAETFRSWADIEDLAHGFENLSTNFEQHRTTAANAFQELYQYIEKTKKEMRGGGLGAVAGGIETDMSMVRRVELLEQRLAMDKAQGSSLSHLVGDPDNIQPRIIRDKTTDQIKLEETLVDYMEIIITLNAKVNNHVHSTKMSMRELDQKLSGTGVGQTLTGGNPANLDYMKIQQRFVDLDTEVEKLRLDLLGQKQNDKMRQEEMEAFFKKASLEYFNKLRDVQTNLEKMRQDQLNQNNMVAKVGILESEVIDLKNYNKTRMLRVGQGDYANDGQPLSEGVANKIDLLLDEVNQIWSFTQRFIDEQAIDMIQEIKSVDHPVKDKMNRMDWLARNAEFLSPDQITKSLLAFKDLFNGKSLPARNAYITARHTSNAVVTVVNLIDYANKLPRDSESESRLAILLSILEPLLINDQNLEKALELPTLQILSGLLELPPNFKNVDRKVDQDIPKLPIYLKYALRCVTSCSRHPTGVDQLFGIANGSNLIIQFVQLLRDEEIVANSAKILRIILREEKYYDQMIKKHSDLGNLLLETAELFQFSEVVLIEILSAARNFTRSTQAASYIGQGNTGILVSLTVNPPNQKIQGVSIETIKNLQKISELDRIIKQTGGHEIVMLLGETNKFAFK